MPFATGTATSIDNLLSQFLAFAVANAGFTAQSTVQSSAGSGSNNIRTVSRGGVHYTFFDNPYVLNASGTFQNQVCCYMSYGVPTAGVNINSQSLAPTTLTATGQGAFTHMGKYGNNGPFLQHWFYTDGTYGVHCVVELATGVFGHISFGSLLKYGGAWAGGEYISAGTAGTTTGGYGQFLPGPTGYDEVCVPFQGQLNGVVDACGTYVRIATAGVTADFMRLANTVLTTVTGNGYMSVNNSLGYSNYISNHSHPIGRLLGRSPSASTWRTSMWPMLFFRGTTTPTDGYYVAGRIPNVCVMMMTDDMLNKAVINTDWRVFPLYARGVTRTPSNPISGNYAIAYREV
jgi:hypothetical protein